MNEQIKKTAETLASIIMPAHNGKDRKRQGAIAHMIEAQLSELCVAVVEHARNPSATDTPADTAGEESPQ
jgi:hypothetical protein